ncbi:phosphatidylinositol synthase 1 (CDP-alcohol phosphatidyltransferase1) [Elasticomyces elasticus]|nr:phosphatidylinositol synthase 1 (CDP-alcohol phosphatidyltransferase1) [Elasticomyces elasticus]
MNSQRLKDGVDHLAGTTQLTGRPANGAPRAPVSAREADDQTDENIFLFVPNLIGYIRIVHCIASLYFMPLHPRRCSFLYSISCLMDALDGIAAGKFQQFTKFGTVLDMVTDRCATTSCLSFWQQQNHSTA